MALTSPNHVWLGLFFESEKYYNALQMPLPLVASVVAQRLQDYSHDNYLQIGSINKGVALAAASLVGLAIFSDRSKWPRATLWLASIVAITISYMTFGRGVILTNARSNLLDSVIPLTMGIVEFTLFGILVADEKIQPNLWRNWFLVNSAHAGLGVCLVANRISNTIVNEDFDSDLEPVANRYIDWMWSDQFGAAAIALASLVIWFLMIKVVWPRWPKRAEMVQSALALLMAFVMLVPIFLADQQRQEMDQMVSNVMRQKLNR